MLTIVHDSRALLLTDPRGALSLKLRAEGGLVRGMALRDIPAILLCILQALRGARQLSLQGLIESLRRGQGDVLSPIFQEEGVEPFLGHRLAARTNPLHILNKLAWMGGNDLWMERVDRNLLARIAHLPVHDVVHLPVRIAHHLDAEAVSP